MMSMSMMIMDGCEKMKKNEKKNVCDFQPTSAKFAECNGPDLYYQCGAA